MIRHALVICTRNRPEDLLETISSVVAQDYDEFAVYVIDSSDEDIYSGVDLKLNAISDIDVQHVRFAESPSLARQRNLALDLLSDTADVVHFLDDDVTLGSDYLSLMDASFRQHSDAAGIGGLLREDGRITSYPRRAFLLRFFLLHSDRPGKVLISGHDSPAQLIELSNATEVDWLNGCSAYRVKSIGNQRCDARLEGYSMDEDLDFSFRVGRNSRLMVEPSVEIYHRKSTADRSAPPKYYSDYLVHRYWFVDKNIKHPMRKFAFWWSTLGRLVRAIYGGKSNRGSMLKGYFSGIRIIIARDHDLL